MYSGLDGVQSILECENYFCEEYYISGAENIYPEEAVVLNETIDKYDEIAAVVYPSSSSFIINSDFYGWKNKENNGKHYIDLFLDFFSKRNIRCLSMQMSAKGVFDDTLGFYNEDQVIANIILKQLNMNAK